MKTIVPVSRNEAGPAHEATTAPPIGEDSDWRKAAVASLERKRKFAADVVLYLAVNGVLWLVWTLTDRSTDGSLPWPAWVSIVWGFFLALDGWRAYGPWPRRLGGPITEADIEQEMRKARRG